MQKKKLIFLALIGLLCLSLAGCGQSGSCRRSSAGGGQPAEEAAGEDGGRP